MLNFVIFFLFASKELLLLIISSLQLLFLSFFSHPVFVNSVLLRFSKRLLPSKQKASITTLRQQTLFLQQPSHHYNVFQCCPLLWTNAHESFVIIEFHCFYFKWENNQHISDICYIWSPPHNKKSIDRTCQMFVEHQL